MEEDGTMLSAEIIGSYLVTAEVETAFNAVTGIGQVESYGTMVMAPPTDLSVYYIDVQLCGILAEKIIAKPVIDVLIIQVQTAVRAIAGGVILLYKYY